MPEEKVFNPHDGEYYEPDTETKEKTEDWFHKFAEERGLDKIRAPKPKAPGDLRIIGGFIGDLDWWCQFEFTDANTWRVHFLDESDNWTDLVGDGATHREAFDSLITRYKILNGGTAGYIMRRLLPTLENSFNDDGQLRESILSQLEHTEGVWTDI